MMSEGDGLSTLKMSVAGHDGVLIFLGLFGYNPEKVAKQRGNRVKLLAKIKTHVDRHLIVAASRRVQPLSRVADTLCKLKFHKAVNILGRRVDFKTPLLYFRKDFFERDDNFIHVLGRNNALLAKHCRMGDRALDVLFIHRSVKGNRRIEIVGIFIKSGVQSVFPKFHENSP